MTNKNIFLFHFTIREYSGVYLSRRKLQKTGISGNVLVTAENYPKLTLI